MYIIQSTQKAPFHSRTGIIKHAQKILRACGKGESKMKQINKEIVQDKIKEKRAAKIRMSQNRTRCFVRA